MRVRANVTYGGLDVGQVANVDPQDRKWVAALGAGFVTPVEVPDTPPLPVVTEPAPSEPVVEEQPAVVESPVAPVVVESPAPSRSDPPSWPSLA